MSEYNIQDYEIAQLKQQIQQLEQENDELKEELEIYKNQSPLATQAFVASYKNYKKQAEDNYKLWQEAERCLRLIKQTKDGE